MVIVGFSNLGTGQLATTAIPILMALLVLTLLIWRSNRIETPILELKLFKNHSFTGHIIGFFCIQLISLGNAFLLPNFIQLVNHNTAQQFAGAVGTSITSAIVASSQKGTKSADLTRIGTQHAYIFLLCLVILIMALFIKYVDKRTATK